MGVVLQVRKCGVWAHDLAIACSAPQSEIKIYWLGSNHEKKNLDEEIGKVVLQKRTGQTKLFWALCEGPDEEAHAIQALLGTCKAYHLEDIGSVCNISIVHF